MNIDFVVDVHSRPKCVQSVKKSSAFLRVDIIVEDVGELCVTVVLRQN